MEFLSIKNNMMATIVSRVGSFLNAFKTPLLFWLYMLAVMAYAYGS
jgi:hypothetical protein